jgi:hypothetical protein
MYCIAIYSFVQRKTPFENNDIELGRYVSGRQTSKEGTHEGHDCDHDLEKNRGLRANENRYVQLIIFKSDVCTFLICRASHLEKPAPNDGL